MNNAVHFIGFRDKRAFDVCCVFFGVPDFIHPTWDVRAQQEIAPGDLAVFAPDCWGKEPSMNAFDDSGAGVGGVHEHEIALGERTRPKRFP